MKDFFVPLQKFSGFYTTVQYHNGARFPRWQEASLIIAGVFFKSSYHDRAHIFRSYLNELSAFDFEQGRVADLGDIVLEDIDAVKTLFFPLLKKLMEDSGARILLFGDLDYISVAMINSLQTDAEVGMFDVAPVMEVRHGDLQSVINPSSKHLRKLHFLGVQNHYLKRKLLKKINPEKVNLIRYADIRSNYKVLDLYTRSSDLIFLNFRSTARYLAREESLPYVTGFDVNDWLHSGYYSGISPVNKIFGINFQNLRDDDLLRIKSLTMWHFLKGFDNNIDDYPLIPKNKLTEVVHKENGKEYKFYVNEFTNRWWKCKNGGLEPFLPEV
jgi:hypothetical protein